MHNQLTSVPPEARAALEAGRVGEALRIVRPIALVTWVGEGVISDEIMQFLDDCMETDRTTVLAVT
jgi:hypothetical protein